MKTKELELWRGIDHKYMTEESEGEDDTITVHELPWRSTGMLQLTFSEHVM